MGGAVAAAALAVIHALMFGLEPIDDAAPAHLAPLPDRTGAVVDEAVAVIVDPIADLGRGLPRHTWLLDAGQTALGEYRPTTQPA
jgi:hypothetical protein